MILVYNRRMLTDADILQRLTNVEDATVERKVASDLAFSNSLPVGDPGVRDNGQPEGIADSGIESHLMKLSKELGNIYPTIFPQLIAHKAPEGLNFVAVIVTGSPNRPHFAGQSYIRDDSRVGRKLSGSDCVKEQQGERGSEIAE